MVFAALLLMLSFSAKVIHAECSEQSDGESYNEMSEFSFKLGPPGLQNGHPNPVGIPPTMLDVQFDYVTSCGTVWGLSVSPGLTYGRRYRSGPNLYGDMGAGLILSAQGGGPGIYAALGSSFNRTSNVSFDMELKKAMAWNLGSTGIITTPYAIRMGMTYRW
jgi:hypothetical protein